MTPMIVVGVDGGGSKTQVMVASADGTQLALVTGPGSAVRPGTAEDSADVIESLIGEALAACGHEAAKPAAICAGLAGVGRDDEYSAIVAALSLLLVTGVAGAAAGRLLAPLRLLRATAEDISVTDLSRRVPVRGNDDITALSRTVNTMLTRLEEAFAGQRRFLESLSSGPTYVKTADSGAGLYDAPIGEGPLSDPACCSMGNPHGTFFVPDVEGVDIPAYGPKLEHHPMFPRSEEHTSELQSH